MLDGTCPALDRGLLQVWLAEVLGKWAGVCSKGTRREPLKRQSRPGTWASPYAFLLTFADQWGGDQ